MLLYRLTTHFWHDVVGEISPPVSGDLLAPNECQEADDILVLDFGDDGILL